MEYFKINREDNCIWLTDLRDESRPPIHLVPSQAQEVGEALIEIAEPINGMVPTNRQHKAS